MSTQEYDSKFIAQMQAASKRRDDAAAPATPTGINGTATAVSDPTFDLRRKPANLCEAVMLRVFEMEAAGNAMLEAAKKLRAAVLANT